MIDIEFNDDIFSDIDRFPWELSFEEFIGSYKEDRVYTIEGRSDFEYDWIWDVADDEGALTDILAENSYGYYVRQVKESFEPTFILFDPDGNSCGFYKGVETWVDFDHRGMDLSVILISTAAIMAGGSPNNGKAYGFSPSGVRAHKKAHEFLVNYGLENGFHIDEANISDYGLSLKRMNHQ